MSIVLALNLIFALLVIAAIVGGLAWSIASQNLDASAGLVRTARRRRRTTARAQFIGQPVDHRA
jgi:hypothetical protein